MARLVTATADVDTWFDSALGVYCDHTFPLDANCKLFLFKPKAARAKHFIVTFVSQCTKESDPYETKVVCFHMFRTLQTD